MQLLIALVVFIIGFMVFGSLFYGVARVFFNKKMSSHNLNFNNDDRNRSINMRVNKSHNVYSFK